MHFNVYIYIYIYLGSSQLFLVEVLSSLVVGQQVEDNPHPQARKDGKKCVSTELIPISVVLF